MGSDVVVPFKSRSVRRVVDQRAGMVDCWQRLREVIQDIPDESIKQEAIEFWNDRVPRVLHGS